MTLIISSLTRLNATGKGATGMFIDIYRLIKRDSLWPNAKRGSRYQVCCCCCLVPSGQSEETQVQQLDMLLVSVCIGMRKQDRSHRAVSE